MPTLHRFVDRAGFYVKAISNGKQVAFQLSSEGETYMTATLGLRAGSKFSGETLKLLYRQKWVVSLPEPPAEPVVEVAAPPGPVAATFSGRADNNPVVFPGVVHIQLTAGDHVLLDQSVEEVVRILGRTGAGIIGPIPLPVRVEVYTVIRDQQRTEHPLRIYQRLLMVRQPRRLTVEGMNEFRLAREVDVKIEMRPGKR